MHKLLRIIFNRMVVNSTLIVGQIMFIFAFFYYLDQVSMVIYFLTMVIGGLICLIILNNNSAPDLKIPWLLLLVLFPILGVILYLLNGNKKEREIFIKSEVKAAHYKRQDAYMIKILEAENKAISGQAKYIVNIANFHLYDNTRAAYYPLGEEMFEDLLIELKKAKKFIFLQFFIISDGFMWSSILEVLKEKVEEGVDIRVIYDDIGSIWTLPSRYYRDLQKMGIKCEAFNRLRPNLSIRYTNRDHRKLVVIDGNVGYTGSMNIGDEYINKIERFGHWKDSGIKLEGCAVQNLTYIFLNAWDMITEFDDKLEDFLPTIKLDISDGYFSPYDDNPLDSEMVGKNVYLNMINSAVDYVYITTPYLVLNHEFLSALINASKRGVQVIIITPSIPDKWVVHAITQSFYPILIDAGVEIYEYDGFMHSKVFVCDDIVGVVGTINLDYRSLYHHYENAVWIYNSSVLKDIKKDINATKNKSNLMSLEKFKSTPWLKRLIGALAKIFAPLM